VFHCESHIRRQPSNIAEISDLECSSEDRLHSIKTPVEGEDRKERRENKREGEKEGGTSCMIDPTRGTNFTSQLRKGRKKKRGGKKLSVYLGIEFLLMEVPSRLRRCFGEKGDRKKEEGGNPTSEAPSLSRWPG